LLERGVQTYLQSSEGKPDFSSPAGEPALAAPDSVSWQVFRNPVALFMGGIAAVILEFAEPRVREGVWAHSRFRTDPLGRLRGTGLAAMVTVYGARSRAEGMIAGVVRAHDRVDGTTPTGMAYRASDPELLTWVQATAAFGFLEAFQALVEPLSQAERDRFYGEGITAGQLYGVPDPPGSEAEIEDCFRAMAPRLETSPVLFEFLDIMRRAPILPPGARLLQPMLVRAAVSILPDWTRERLKLGRRWQLTQAELHLLRRAARFAQTLRLDSSPSAQACLRLGLAADHLQFAWSRRLAG
jgi:uncharacterized protein (DUF2236 family)